MTRDEARAWLAGSAVDTILIHRTSPTAAQEIITRGVVIQFTEPQPTWGHGFYASARADPQYGEAEVRMAIRLMQPLIIADTIDGAEIIDRHLVGFGTEDIRDALCAAGYDGVVLHLDQSDLLVVAYYAHQVRVIIG